MNIKASAGRIPASLKAQAIAYLMRQKRRAK
jgi:hypothetical protein